MQKIQVNRKGNSTFISAMIPFGSYYEEPKVKGIAHFIEHLLFKGTKNRTRHEIERAIEGKGGDLNAFTDYELTCYWCNVANKNKDEAVDIIQDMVCNPLFPVKEIDKEREVILQELKMYKDRPSDIIGDISNEIFYPKENGFHISIIGTEQTLKNITRKDIVDTYNKHYKEPTLIVVGDVENKYNFYDYSSKITHTTSYFEKREEHLIKRQNLEQARVIISSEVEMEEYTSMEKYFLQNLLSSIYNDMSGRLFETIREKNHLVYGVSFHTTQRSSGMVEWQVNLGLDANKITKARKLVEQELIRPVSKKELQYATEKLTGTFALMYDDNHNIAELIAYNIRKGINWQDTCFDYEKQINNVSKDVNRFIKNMRFKDNILVGLVPK